MTIESCLKCNLCDNVASDVKTAIDAGWIPSYYEADSDYETCEPICGNCVFVKLVETVDGELELPATQMNY